MFKKWVDVCAGKMTLPEITKEITFQMLRRFPKRLIVDIKRKKGGYKTTIWISEKDFKKRRRENEDNQRRGFTDYDG